MHTLSDVHRLCDVQLSTAFTATISPSTVSSVKASGSTLSTKSALTSTEALFSPLSLKDKDDKKKGETGDSLLDSEQPFSALISVQLGVLHF